ncbi:MAG: glutamate synthase (NADPH/NADH) small chain, partial [bacterium]
MGKITGFLEFPRESVQRKPIEERIKHYKEFDTPLTPYRLKTQASRCMDCGVPFCNWGCPVDNLIPEFNEFVYQDQWKAAYGTLQSTNNFPEFTGRVCPAPCEPACCAGVVETPITIKQIELSIIEKAFEEGWVTPNIVDEESRTGIKIAVVGSGPAGLAAAQQLNLAGHTVTVFEKNEVIGGLLRLGIPDFKLEKWVVERRIDVLRAEGIEFKTNANIGGNVPVQGLLDDYDYICLTGGSEKPRDLPVKGRELEGAHFAMDFLMQQNRRVAGQEIPADEAIFAEGKHVIVIGGGDTGSDCVGTSIRQGAKSVTQLEIMPQPPEERAKDNTWPEWPKIHRTSSSQEEGCARKFSVTTRALTGDGKVEKLAGAEVEWIQDEGGNWRMQAVEGSDFDLQA